MSRPIEAGCTIKEGQPCGHRGCLHHVSHPCEGCGRIAGRGEDERCVWVPDTLKEKV